MSQATLKYVAAFEDAYARHGELRMLQALALAATSSRNYTEWLDDENMELEFNRKFEPLTN